MTSTEQLIENLSKEGKKNCNQTTPVRIFGRWLVGSMASVVVMLAIFGLRADLAEKFTDSYFVAEIFTLMLIVISMAFAAATLSFPDNYQRKYIFFLPPISLVSFVISLGFAYLEKPAEALPEHSFICLFCITMFSMIPAAWAFYLLRKQAPTHLKMAGSTALLAACSIGALTLRLSEKTDSIQHLVLWHYLPMVGYAIIGAWLGKRFLKW
jgi:hypothetical protein